MADNTAASDPVSLFKDAFWPGSTRVARDAAIALMMENPQGFVSGLADVLGSFTSMQFLTRMLEDASAPGPLLEAAGNELRRLGSVSMENKHINLCRLEPPDAGWGEPSGPDRKVQEPAGVKRADTAARPALPDAEMRNKYRETVFGPSHPAALVTKKDWKPASLFLFTLVRIGRS